MKKLYFLTSLFAFLLVFSESFAQINITNGSSNSCSDTLYDTGGATGDYDHNESFEFTISPTSADSVRLYLDSIVLAKGDTIFLYDGANSSAPLILAIDTTTVFPDSITTGATSLTVVFTSDAADSAWGFKLTWIGFYTPNVSVSMSDDSICVGDLITFSVSDSTFGGSNPSFQWKLNGTNVGTDLYKYTVAPSNGDKVHVIMTGNPSCGLSIGVDSSGDDTVTVYNIVTASVSLSATDTTVCSTDTVTFTATPTNGGPSPVYSWTVNGGAVGSNSSTFVSPVSDADSVDVQMASSVGTGCLIDSISSDWVTMDVTTTVTASVSVSATDTTICAGTSVTFTAAPTNGGASPTYAWTVNGGTVGTNSPTYVTTSLADLDSVDVQMASDVGTGCVIDSISSAWTTMDVTTVVTASISLSVDDPSVCSGNLQTFTATPTNGGSTPTYSWRINGSPIANTLSTYVDSTLLNNDYVAVTMASDNGSGCVLDSISADSLQLNINPNPSASISGSIDVSCNGFTTGSATGAGSGGTVAGAYNFLWNDPSNQTTATATGLVTGTYIVTVTDDSTCSDTVSVFISEPTQLALSFSVIDASGFGQSDGSITATGSGGVFIDNGGTVNDGYDHRWSNGANTTSPRFIHTNVSLASGWYTDTISDANSCVYFDSAFVDQPTLLTGGEIRIGGAVSKSICDGAWVGLMNESKAITGGIGAITYTWQFTDNLLNWKDYLNSDSIDYVLNNTIAANKFIRRRVIDNANDSAHSNIIFLYYIADAVVTINGLSTKYCENDANDPIFGSPVGGDFTNTAWIDTVLNEFIPASAVASNIGALNLVTYNYTDANGCFTSNTDSTTVFTIDTGSIKAVHPQDTNLLPQNVFDVDDTTAYLLLSTYAGGDFSGTGVYPAVGKWYFEPNISGVPYSQQIQFEYTNANGCTSYDSISVTVTSTQIKLSTAVSNDLEFSSCYTTGMDSIYALIPAAETVTSYRWIAQHPVTGRLILEYANIQYTTGTFSDTAIPFPFNPKQFLPISKGDTIVKYDSTGVTPTGVTKLRIYFQHFTVANPFNTNLVRNDFELVNLDQAKINPKQLNSNGTGGFPVQYCEDIDTVYFASSVFPLPTRTTTQTYSISPSGDFSDNSKGNGEFYPSGSGPDLRELTLTYVDVSTGCSISKIDTIFVDSLPNVVLTGLPDTNCANDGFIQFTGSPYTINKGNFTSPTSTALSLTHINGSDTASITATALNIGSHSITYTFQETTGCIEDDTAFFDIFALPVLSMNIALSGNFSDPNICVTDSNDIVITAEVQGELTGQVGDSIVGPGIVYPFASNAGQATFNPSDAGAGTHTIRFYYTDSKGCLNFIDSVIVVNGLPNASFITSTNDYSVCNIVEDSLQFTYTGGNTGTSLYSILGSSVSGFKPVTNGDINFGANTVLHQFTESATSCVSYDSISIFVNNFPIVSISNVNPTYCYNNATILFTGLPISPGIGSGAPSYFSSDVSSLNFTQVLNTAGKNSGFYIADSTNIGQQVISYNYTDSSTGCFDSASIQLDIITIPTLELKRKANPNSPLIHCLGDTVHYLKLIDGIEDTSPLSFLIGPGFLDSTSNVFNPDSAGVSVGPNHHTVRYKTTDGNGCSNEIDSTIVVLATSDASFTLSTDSACIDPFNTITITPSFVGGTFSRFEYHGTTKIGQANMTFYLDSASTGKDSVIYIYDDGTGCSDTSTQYVTVKDTPTVNFTNVLPDYCFNQDLHTISVDRPSLGNSYFRSWHYNPGKTFNNLLDSALLLAGDSDITFTPYVVDGIDTISEDFIDLEYIYTDQNGCVGHANAQLYINDLPILEILSDDVDFAVCAKQEQIELIGRADGVDNDFGGYFTGSVIGTANNMVDTSAYGMFSGADYGTVPIDSFFTDTVYFYFTDVTACRNSVSKTIDIKKLPPSFFTIDNGGNPNPKNICPDHFGTTTTLYDNCAQCQVDWPLIDLDIEWYVNDTNLNAVSDGEFNPGPGVNTDTTRYNAQNYIIQRMWDTRWGPECFSEWVDSIYLDTFPVVDIFIDSLYCSNDGAITFAGSPASPFGTGVGIPSVFSSNNMYGQFTDSLKLFGDSTVTVSTDSLAIATTGLTKAYNVEYTFTDPLTNCVMSEQKSFVFKTKPSLNLTAATKVFCPYDDSTAILVNVNTNPATGVGDSIVAQGITGSVSNGVIYYYPSEFRGDTVTHRDPVTYYHTDIDGCQDSYTDTGFIVKAQPVLNLIIDQNLFRPDSLCFNDPWAKLTIQFWDTSSNGYKNFGSLTGQGASGDDNFFSYQIDDVLPTQYGAPNNGPTAKTFDASWDSKNDTSGVVTGIRFIGTYDGVGGCADTIYDSIVTHPEPVARFVLDGTCAKYAPVMHGNNSFIDTLNFSPSDGLLSYLWSIDGKPATGFPAGQGDTLIDYTHVTALSAGNHDIELIVKSNKDCYSDPEPLKITFVESPDALFEWDMDDECIGETLTFDATKSGIPPTANVTYKWLFGDGDSTLADSTNNVVTHMFDTVVAQEYSVTLEIQDGTDCRDTLIQVVSVRPNISLFDTLSNETPYMDDFESPYSGWVVWREKSDPTLEDTTTNPDSLRPSWFTHGERTVGNIQTNGSKGWYLMNDKDSTGGYLTQNLMQTSVTSPCFDFSPVQKPMVTLDLIYAMELNDGVVLQYTTDRGKPLGTVKWENVGDFFQIGNTHYETGINWYAKRDIFGNPGNQTDAQRKLGWTDSTLVWTQSRNDLDSLIGEGYIRFRLAFGSNADLKSEGFIFDNFEIRERKKNIVFETFTNSSQNSYLQTMTDYDEVVENSLDIMDIQYHTSFPASDPMNDDNTSDPSARSIYYGISEVPFLQGDGNKYAGFLNSQSFGFFTLKPRSLEDPKFSVNMIFDPATNKVETEIVPLSEEFLNNPVDITLHIALVEKTINGSEFGANVASSFKNYDFKNTLKRLYPTAAGTSYTGLIKGDVETTTTEILYENFYGPTTEFKVVAFVQDKKTKEIYQGNWIDYYNQQTVGEPEYNKIVSDGIDYTLYPNPTKGLTYMRFDKMLEDSYQLNIYNQVGVLVSQEIVPAGTSQYSFDITGLTQGMYFIMLNDGTHKVAIKKLMLTR